MLTDDQRDIRGRTANDRGTRTARLAAERALKAKPDDLDARFRGPRPIVQLGEDRKALDDLDAMSSRRPRSRPRPQYRAIVDARLGRKKEALDDWRSSERETPRRTPGSTSAVVVAAELAEGRDEACARLESALKRTTGFRPGLRCRLCLRPGIAGPEADEPAGPDQAERAIRLLRRRSKTATRTTITFRRTPTSTRSGTSRLRRADEGGSRGSPLCRRLDQ